MKERFFIQQWLPSDAGSTPAPSTKAWRVRLFGVSVGPNPT